MSTAPLDLHNLAAGANLAAGSSELQSRRTGFTVRQYPDGSAELYWTGKGAERRPVDPRQRPIYAGTVADVAAMLAHGEL